jgi:hypothetical protein
MEEEFKHLHAIFRKLGELHSHLKKLQEIPPQYIQEVKRVIGDWKFQKNFVKPLPSQFYEPFMQMETIVSGFWIDFYLEGVFTIFKGL